jgi:hypothetical protein
MMQNSNDGSHSRELVIAFGQQIPELIVYSVVTVLNPGPVHIAGFTYETIAGRLSLHGKRKTK